ncbi:TRAP transporter small permease [Spiractinospora alimapuensis]|uniref:TRAP transporter small permease n=1 Tax=Spiractinospora alimapuensis TaxID=2820884 RepID=UPI001F3B00BD|nr:TRAP transporter small permease [Spiractinospora alimapuensis]QVQ53797.1 TRAP transporter small permease [Spiractinospora alimapuensis]
MRSDHPLTRAVRVGVTAVEEWVPSLLLLGITLLVAYGVLARYVLGQPVAFINELAVLVAAWVVLLGAAAATRRRMHVGIDALIARLTGRPRAAADAVMSLAVFVGVGVLAYLSVEFVLHARGDLFVLGISKKWLYASLPVGLCLMTLHLGTQAFGAVRGLWTGEYSVTASLQAQSDMSAESRGAGADTAAGLDIRSETTNR